MCLTEPNPYTVVYNISIHIKIDTTYQISIDGVALNVDCNIIKRKRNFEQPL